MLHEALARMPHHGDMRLIEHVASAGPDDIHCIARPVDGDDYPLRLNGVLYGVALAELGAQTAAAHASLFGIGTAHMGLVLSFSGLDVHCDVVRGPGPVEIRAERIATTDEAASYRFRVMAGEETIVSGDALLSIRRKAG